MLAVRFEFSLFVKQDFGRVGFLDHLFALYDART
jgi:hypothetical protein